MSWTGSSLVLLAGLALAGCWPAWASVHGKMYCWYSDVEFPVDCDEDEDDDGASIFPIPLEPSRAFASPWRGEGQTPTA